MKLREEKYLRLLSELDGCFKESEQLVDAVRQRFEGISQ